MAKLDLTYQVAPVGASAMALEEFVVETSAGERVGKVQTILEGDDGLLLAVEVGTPPLRRQVHLVSWDQIATIDRETLSVRLALTTDELEDTPELDPSRSVETEDADLRRVKQVPDEFRPRSVAPGSRYRGPVDRTALYVSLATGLLGVFAFFAVIVVATRVEMTWHWILFAIPLALLALSGLIAYNVFRNPTART